MQLYPEYNIYVFSFGVKYVILRTKNFYTRIVYEFMVFRQVPIREIWHRNYLGSIYKKRDQRIKINPRRLSVTLLSHSCLQLYASLRHVSEKKYTRKISLSN